MTYEVEATMTPDDLIFILGGADPEMEMIEHICRAAGLDVVYAKHGAQRVHPGNAYQADGTSAPIPDGARIVTVECVVAGVTPWRHCDHHRAGDRGYGRPPSDFFTASSIGQVCAILAAPSTSEILLCAASDHCLSAAYHGLCPGVDPGELMRWRAKSRAKFQGRTVDAILADVTATTEALRNAAVITVRGCCCASYADIVPSHLCEGDVDVADMRREPPYPELPEAACRLGVGYISGPLIGPDGRRKITCSGSAPQIRAFLSYWAPSQGITDTYGDPMRGFAGGYLA